MNQLAECVGLWLAEGDNKSIGELTFTNNCVKLVKHFHKCMTKQFSIELNNIRIYSYSKEGKARINITGVRKRHYFYTRARKPYFIWRFASREFMKVWKAKVEKICSEKSNYANILRGFFAGEGSIKETGWSRCISMSQKKRIEVIDKALEYLGINYSFEKKHNKGYIIVGREKWDRFYNTNIHILHPDKMKKFIKIYRGFKEYHYSHGYLRKEILKSIETPKTAKTLANELKRSQDRTSEVLIDLKKEGLAKNFQVYSTNYWISSDRDIVIISKRKIECLKLIRKGMKRTYEIANKMKIDYKGVERRLAELERLELIERNKSKEWSVIDRMTLECGIDEAGRFV